MPRTLTNYAVHVAERTHGVRAKNGVVVGLTRQMQSTFNVDQQNVYIRFAITVASGSSRDSSEPTNGYFVFFSNISSVNDSCAEKQSSRNSAILSKNISC